MLVSFVDMQEIVLKLRCALSLRSCNATYSEMAPCEEGFEGNGRENGVQCHLALDFHVSCERAYMYRPYTRECHDIGSAVYCSVLAQLLLEKSRAAKAKKNKQRERLCYYSLILGGGKYKQADEEERCWRNNPTSPRPAVARHMRIQAMLYKPFCSPAVLREGVQPCKGCKRFIAGYKCTFCPGDAGTDGIRSARLLQLSERDGKGRVCGSVVSNHLSGWEWVSLLLIAGDFVNCPSGISDGQ